MASSNITDSQQLTRDIDRVRTDLINAIAAVISDDITDKTDVALVALQFLVGHMPSRHDLPTSVIAPVVDAVKQQPSRHTVDDVEPDPTRSGPYCLGWPGVRLRTFADGTQFIETDSFGLTASDARDVAASLLSAAARVDAAQAASTEHQG
jgi:hypothetical protein